MWRWTWDRTEWLSVGVVLDVLQGIERLLSRGLRVGMVFNVLQWIERLLSRTAHAVGVPCRCQALRFPPNWRWSYLLKRVIRFRISYGKCLTQKDAWASTVSVMGNMSTQMDAALTQEGKLCPDVLLENPGTDWICSHRLPLQLNIPIWVYKEFQSLWTKRERKAAVGEREWT